MHFIENLARGAVFLTIDQMFGKQEMADDVVAVLSERAINKNEHLAPVARQISTAKAGIQIGIVRKSFQTFRENLRSEIRIIFVQRQIPAGQVSFAAFRISLLGFVE